MENNDLTQVAEIVMPNNRKILYAENAHNFTKVAFDVFQLNNAPVESYWILETAEDGKEYLVAKYNDDTIEVLANKKWDVILDSNKKNATLVYKDIPIQRFASNNYNFNKDNAHIFQRTLADKMNNDTNFVKAFINTQSEERKKELLSIFPELA